MTVVVLAVFVLGGLVLLEVWITRWQYRTAEARLEQWAEQSRHQVLSKERANPYGTGPMSGRGGSNQQVMYRVTVRDADGREKRGLVKVGSKWVGVHSHELVVEWDDDPGP
ncbi:MAG: hypothetical protein JWN04_1804 [Myxococcaceae bacterium]|nr:hypothetical protein [Myxococcaceae bacterium]